MIERISRDRSSTRCDMNVSGAAASDVDPGPVSFLEAGIERD